MHLEYVKRSVSPDSDYDGVTTDVFVRIDTLIKGEPNLGKRHLRFMIEDGTFFSERDDAFITAQVGSQPTYEVRERVMLFLKDGSQDPVYYGKWPYNGLHGNVLIGDYGKLLLDDEGLLEFHYYIDSHSKRVSGVAMRWGLVGVLGQAIVADKEAASKLEDKIAGFVKYLPHGNYKLPEPFVYWLFNEAEKILEASNEKE